MRHRIERHGDDLRITVDEAEGRQEALLEAFQECQEGRCSCPTNEYEKLERMEVSAEGGTVSLRLTAREGERFDTEEIEACLEYTEARVAEDPSGPGGTDGE